jgi:hypothetical protein
MLMDSKAIALVITFAAVAIALNAIRLPTVFYPGTYFQLSQIPIIIAFLLFGFKIGVFVGLLNLIGGLVLFPIGAVGLIVYPADFLSSLLMIAGIWIAMKFTIYNTKSRIFPVFEKPAIGLILGAIALRVGIMPFFDYAVVYHVLVPLILGIKPSEGYIVGLVPAFVLYNTIVAFYVVSAAYVITAKVRKPLKIRNKPLH